jgi:hypothetical protein
MSSSAATGVSFCFVTAPTKEVRSRAESSISGMSLLHLTSFGCHSQGNAVRDIHRPKNRKIELPLSSTHPPPPPPSYTGSKQARRRRRRREIGGLRQYNPRSAHILGQGFFTDDDMLCRATFQSLNLVPLPLSAKSCVQESRAHTCGRARLNAMRRSS